MITSSTRLNVELMGSFIYGIVMAPFTSNLITLILFLILYEIIIALYLPPYRIVDRCKLLYSYISGFLIGRTIYAHCYEEEILPSWIP